MILEVFQSLAEYLLQYPYLHSGLLLFITLFLCFPKINHRAVEPLLFFGILIAQLPDILASSSYTSDEPQLIVQARMFLEGRLPWGGVDTTTSGPLPSLWLLWGQLFFGEISEASSRIVSILTAALTVLVFYRGLRINFLRQALPLSLILWAIYAFQVEEFHQEYHTAVLPSFFFALAFYCHARFIHSSKSAYLWVCLFLLGLQFATKLQAAPASFTAALVLILQVSSIGKKKTLFIKGLLALGMTPLLCTLFSLVTGTFEDYLVSYLGMGLDYNAGYIIPGLSGHNFWLGFSTYAHHRTWTPWTVIMLFAFAFSCFLQPPRWNAKILPFLGMGLAMIGAILLKRMLLVHYFPLIGICLYPLVIMNFGNWAKSNEARNKYLQVGCALFLLGFLVLHLSISRPDFFRRQLPRNEVSSYLREKASAEDKLFVWGWDASYHLLSGISPATRDSITQMAVAPGRFQDYYRKRLLEDLQDSPPEWIVDATCATLHFKNQCRFQQFPELKMWVEEKYRFERVYSFDAENPVEVWKKI